MSVSVSGFHPHGIACPSNAAPPPLPAPFLNPCDAVSPLVSCGFGQAPTRDPQINPPRYLFPPSLLMSFVPRRRRSHEERRTERLFSNLLLPPYPEKGGKRRPWLLLPLLPPFRRRRIPEKVVSAPSPPLFPLSRRPTHKLLSHTSCPPPPIIPQQLPPSFSRALLVFN